MQKQIQKKINMLVLMSGVQASYETLEEEKKALEIEINEKKSELKTLKKSMRDENYVRENERLIDENIKLGLENKSSMYKDQLQSVINTIDKINLDEEDTHKKIKSCSARLSKVKDLILSLQLKLRAVNKDKKLYSFYEQLIDENEKEVSELEKKKELLNASYEKIKEKLEHFANQKLRLEERLRNIESKLVETLDALANPNSYIDYTLKNEQLRRIDEVTLQLDDLENAKLKVITSPSYIAHEAIRLYEEDDRTSSLATLKELLTIVKAKPYMNLNNEELKSALEEVTAKRDELANMMENNSYLGEDFDVLDERISYLEEQIKELDEEENRLKEEIKSIDEKDVVTINKYLDKVKELSKSLEEEYEHYKEIIFSKDEHTSPRKKASLEAAFRRKKEELQSVNDLVELYQNELEKKLLLSRDMEMVNLKDISKKKDEINEEIEQLKKRKSSFTHAKDILAMENDKRNLQKLNDDVDAIKERMKFDNTPDEIYDEIELSLYTKDEDLEENKEDDVVEDFANLDDYRISNDLGSSSVLEPTLDVEPISFHLDPIKIDEEEQEYFPPRDNSRLKVVKVEELSKLNEEQNESKDVVNSSNVEPNLEILGNDTNNVTNNDEEYLSFNDILNGGELNGN